MVDRHIVRCMKKNAALLNLEGQLIYNDLSQQQPKNCNAPYCDAPIKKVKPHRPRIYGTIHTRYIITAPTLEP